MVAELEELREIVPPYMTLGQLVAFLPAPPFWTRRYSPWGKLDDFRKAFDRIVLTLIDRADADPGLGKRTDVLAFLLRSRHADGTGISRRDMCDELLTLVCAGHETTASALGWAFERLRRHPDVLAELVREVDEGGSDFRRATIMEVLRIRTVIDVAGRRVRASNFDLGEWRIPHNRTVLVRIADLHENPEIYPHPERFDPCIASAAPSRRQQHGWRSVAEHGGASALISRSPKWISCCGRCCRTSGSRPMPPPMRSPISGELPTPRNSAAASW